MKSIILNGLKKKSLDLINEVLKRKSLVKCTMITHYRITILYWD